jgi:hypothetical protein
VIIISSGIIQVSPELFDSQNDFQVRIEHKTCDRGQFLLDILDFSKSSIFVDLFDYTAAISGGIGCRLNYTK